MTSRVDVQPDQPVKQTRHRGVAGEHIPVLLHETMGALIGNPSGVYVDATFGRGGHCKALLEQLAADARVIALDRDPSAVAAAKALSAGDTRFNIVHNSFSQISAVLEAELTTASVDGILMDIGVSSPQLDDPARGFSFRTEGPLDMRMDPTCGPSAAEWLNTAAEADIAEVLFVHGEERHARRIAREIVAQRPLHTTTELADVVASLAPTRKAPYKKHPATKTFQAVRIYINGENEELASGLEQSFGCLKLGGRLAVISFHSLEDRHVKQTFRAWSQPPALPRNLPIRADKIAVKGRLVGGAIKAQAKELTLNPRARSAVLRVIERVA